MLFIARRYLFSARARSVVNIIAGVSLVSVAIPVAAIIILLSVFNGFGELVEGMNKAVDAELTITPSRGRYFELEEIDSARLRGLKGVEALSVVCEQQLMVASEGREAVVRLRGVDSDFSSVVPIGDYMFSGDFNPSQGDLDRVVIGGALAMKLGVRNYRETKLYMYSLRSSRLDGFEALVAREVDSAKVVGIYSLDVQSEEQIIYSSLRFARRMLGGRSGVSSIIIKSEVGSEVESLRADIEQVVGDGYRVRTREELNPVLYDIIKYEKWGILFISTMVMLLASLSLVGVVAMFITEKRADVGTLRVMGATRKDVRYIFFLQGMMLSKIGVFAGVVIGVGVALSQQYFGFLKLPAGAFVIDSYPVDVQVWDVVSVVVIAVGIASALNYIVTFRMIKK